MHHHDPLHLYHPYQQHNLSGYSKKNLKIVNMFGRIYENKFGHNTVTRLTVDQQFSTFLYLCNIYTVSKFLLTT